MARVTPQRPYRDDALRELATDFASPPDMPVGWALREHKKLARVSALYGTHLRTAGVSARTVRDFGLTVERLEELHHSWNKARHRAVTSPLKRRLMREAESLRTRLWAAMDIAYRNEDARTREHRVTREETALVDTLADLRDLIATWHHPHDAKAAALVPPRVLGRAMLVAAALDSAALEEGSSDECRQLMDLRNRCYWAADASAEGIRLAARYSFVDDPHRVLRFGARLKAVRPTKVPPPISSLQIELPFAFFGQGAA